MSKLAPTYGISDVMLKKICRQMDIPTPPRGYWAKVQNNIRVDIELERREDLEKQAENWVKSRHLREYIQAVEIAASKQGLSGPSHEGYTFWMRWAKAHADRLDPLTNGLPFENETE